MSGDWTPDQPLRADATDEQIKARYNECYADSGIKRSDLICYIAREFAEVWLQRYADATAKRDFLMAEGRASGLIVGVPSGKEKSPVPADWRNDEAVPWHEDEALNESIGALVDDRHLFGTLSRGAAWSVVLDICTKAVAASCGRGTEGEDTKRLDWLAGNCMKLINADSTGVFLTVYGEEGDGSTVSHSPVGIKKPTLREAIDAARFPEKPNG